ncbi:transposase [Candidatus Roizmanbacteria bacterium]|nr:transposase [Candidatus Roizmanbacteria bacterium]
MPGRLMPLVNNQIYHVFNRGIDHRPTFTDKSELTRGIMVIDFYRFAKPPMRLSKFLKLSNEERDSVSKNIRDRNEKLIDMLAFCLMPNHFHFVLRQLHDDGISKFLANFQNSYTRYFNVKGRRNGPLFLDQFKAVRIETDEQLLHVSRYVHLNPLTSYVVKGFKDLLKYPWSSLGDYINSKSLICELNTVLGFFKNKRDYKTFVEDNAGYQRELDEIKHLVLEESYP